MRLHSRQLVEHAMRLRPQYNRYGRVHPIFAKKLQRITQPPQPLIYPMHPNPFSEVTPSSPIQTNPIILPHPPPLGPLTKLPFFISRSRSGNLPVYVDYKDQRNVKRTIIRRIEGDIDAFTKELTKVISNYEPRVKVGSIEIPGIHRESVLRWLIRLGF